MLEKKTSQKRLRKITMANSTRDPHSLFHVICGCVNWSAFLMLCSIWGLNCVRMFSRRTLRRQTMAYIERDLLNSTQTCNKHISDVFRAFSSYRLDVVVVVFFLFTHIHAVTFVLNWAQFRQMHSKIVCYWTDLVIVLLSNQHNIIFRSYWFV